MREITLPERGPIYLDASGFIYSVERVEPYHTLLDPMWKRARTGQFTIATGEITILETLVKPIREGDSLTEAMFRETLNAEEVNLIRTTREIWEEATIIRATTGLKTQDALHAATARTAKCTLLVTNDHAFRRVTGLPVTILNELI